MRDFILHNKQTLALFILSYAIAFVSPIISAGLVIYLLFRFKKLGDYKSILFGFILVIIMSDSRQSAFKSATDLKLFYVVVMILFMFFDSVKFKPYSSFYKPFLLFAVYALFLTILNPNFFISLQRTFSYAFIFFIIPNYFKVCYDAEGEFFIRDFYYFIFSFILLGLILIPILPEKILFLEKRYTGLLGNPNGLGLYTSIFFVLFSITQNLFPTLFTKQEKILFYLAIIISIILTGSRNSLIAIIIFTLSSFFFQYSVLLGLSIIILTVIGKDFITDFIFNSITNLGLSDFFRLETAEKVSGRLVAWEFALENIQKNYFFGRGFDYTNYLYGKYHQMLSMKGHLGNAHNSYLTLWLDTGIVGLILIYRALIISYLKVVKASHMIIPALISFLFSMFFESWFAASLNPFTFQLILIVLLAEIKIDNKNSTLQNIPQIK